MSTVRRIIDFIEFSGMSKREFYKKTKLSNGYLDKVKEFGSDKIESIISVFPDLNLQWVITGQGYMLKKKPAIINLSGSVTEEQKKDTEEQRRADNIYNSIPVFINTFPAQEGTTHSNNIPMPDYYMHIPEYADCKACKIYTDTLIRSIPKESYIFIREVPEWRKFLEFGRMYEILLTDGRGLHYIIERSINENVLFLSPDNDELQAFELAKDLVKSIWIICGFLPPPII